MLTAAQCAALDERDRLELGQRAADCLTTENVPFTRDVSESVINTRARYARDAAKGLVVWVKGQGWVPVPAYLAQYEARLAEIHAADARTPPSARALKYALTYQTPGTTWPPEEA